MDTHPIVHIFPAHAGHLIKSLVPQMVALFGARETVIYVRDAAVMTADQRDGVLHILSVLPSGVRRGWLGRGPLGRWSLAHTSSKIIAGLKELYRALCLDFKPSAFIKLAWGPRNILVHGYSLSLVTMLLLRLTGHKVSLIHWGGKPPFSKKTGFISKLSARLHHRIYVLMSPELRYFACCDRKNRMGLLPYPGRLPPYETCVQTFAPRLILGNSAWSVTGYDAFLSCLRPSDWERIVCMLNYGMEHNRAVIDMFARDKRTHFGDCFYAWTETVPLDEYRKIMRETPMYVCPRATQTGLGAIYLSVLQGKTLFLRGDNFRWMADLGVKAYDLDQMTDFSLTAFKTLFLGPREQAKNRDAMIRHYVEDLNEALWQDRIRNDFEG